MITLVDDHLVLTTNSCSNRFVIPRTFRATLRSFLADPTSDAVEADGLRLVRRVDSVEVATNGGTFRIDWPSAVALALKETAE